MLACACVKGSVLGCNSGPRSKGVHLSKARPGSPELSMVKAHEPEILAWQPLTIWLHQQVSMHGHFRHQDFELKQLYVAAFAREPKRSPSSNWPQKASINPGSRESSSLQVRQAFNGSTVSRNTNLRWLLKHAMPNSCACHF